MTSEPRRLGSLHKWYGRTDLGIDVMDAARRRTEYAFDNFDFVWVSFSGGKDSTCVLNVALDVARDRDRLPLEVVFFDEECISLETIDYVRRTMRNPELDITWWCLPVQHRNACSTDESYWWPWAPEAKDRWVRPLPPEALTEHERFPVWPPLARPSIPHFAPYLYDVDRGKQACLMGIRAAESIMRLKAVTNRRADNFVLPSESPTFWKVYPIYDWTTEDVWTAPAELGWDYNETYDVMEMAGIGHAQQRCAPPFGEEPRRDLWMWATCFPDLWDRMCDRVPGAAAAARYSRTELYGHGTAVEKPEGMTWPDFVLALIDRHPDAGVRDKLTAKIDQSIRYHYRITADPILPHANHPATATSWRYIVSLAERGDTKNRRQAMRSIQQHEVAKVTAAYEAERARYERGELEGMP